jgi:4-amino-4-deoxy-L-arabinose transferase-like glycosyltransferase
MKSWAPLAVILALFVVLGSQFISKTPYREGGYLMNQPNSDGTWAYAADIGAPDERQHANYIARIADGGGLAVLKPGAEDLYESYQAHQPPLYYWLGAGWAKLTNADHETLEGGRKLRWLNLLIGAGTIVGFYYLVFWGTGRREPALAAAAFGLMPMHIALSAAVSNDPLLILLCTWTLAATAWAMADGWSLKRALLIGGLAGLALITKTSALALVPAIGAAFIVSAIQSKRRSEKVNWSLFGVAAGLALMIVIPWWLRNQQLYGDPLAMSVFKEAFTGNPTAEPFIERLGFFGYFKVVYILAMQSFVGVFGYMDIFVLEHQGLGAVNRFYWGSLLIIGILKILGLVGVFKKSGDELDAKRAGFWWPVLIFGLVIDLLFFQFNLQYFQAQARYLYPAAGVVAALLGFGFWIALKSRAHLAWAAAAGFFALLSLAAVRQLDLSFELRLNPPPEVVSGL